MKPKTLEGYAAALRKIPKSVSLYLVEAKDRTVERLINESFKETMVDIEKRMGDAGTRKRRRWAVFESPRYTHQGRRERYSLGQDAFKLRRAGGEGRRDNHAGEAVGGFVSLNRLKGSFERLKPSRED